MPSSTIAAFSDVAANGNNGELLSGSVASHSAGLAVSYSSAAGLGIVRVDHAGSVGSYSNARPVPMSTDRGSGGLEGMSRSEDSCSVNSDESSWSSSSISVDGRDRQNSGTGWLSWTAETVALIGLGKVGMVKTELRSDCDCD
jgi:hypothetical protein